MVPSDPSNSPFSDRHARPEHGMQCSRNSHPLAPRNRFCTATDQCARICPRFYLLEAFASKRPFARPQRLPSFEGHRSEVNAPDLSLQRNSKLLFRPVRFSAPILCRALHAAGVCSLPQPVAVFPAQNSQTSIQFPLPFRTFTSFRIEALNRWLGLRSLPLCPARFPFAPRKRQLVLVTIRLRIIVPGSLPFTRLTAL